MGYNVGSCRWQRKKKEKTHMSHFTIENRKTISRMIAHGAKCKEIAAVLGCDPTSVSKEVKRNRMTTKSPATGKKFLCRRLDRFPFVCRDVNVNRIFTNSGVRIFTNRYP